MSTPPSTIYALSSGTPPAAIAVVRISGPNADTALLAVAGRLPEPRRASLARLADPATGETLDDALVLRFPGPATATGEDLVELHLHGGRSVVAAVLGALARLEGLRAAEPGEFTRRAFENGRIDLAEAEGLADLLSAETESQRRAALTLAGGALSRAVAKWQDQILALSAQVEAALDFADEGDVEEDVTLRESEILNGLILDLRTMLDRPPVERLRDGIRVVIAGPPNAGKSSLLNHLAGREAAITSAVAGTTRDVIEAPAAIGGTPFILVDTAGLRESSDTVEAIGVERAQQSLGAADIILWLGDPEDRPDPERSLLVRSKADLRHGQASETGQFNVSSITGQGMGALIDAITEQARNLLPIEGEVSINSRHRGALAECYGHLTEAKGAHDLLLASEALRLARLSLDRITGRAGVENMLDALFGRFCIGK